MTDLGLRRSLGQLGALSRLTPTPSDKNKGLVLRIAATLGRISGANVDGGNDGTNTQHISRNAHRTGRHPVKGLRVVSGNFKLLGLSPFGEAGVGNAYTIKSAIEYSGANAVATWGGAASKSVADLSFEISDPILDLPAGAQFWSRHYLTVADVTKKWPTAQSISANGQSGRKSTDLAASFAATGALAVGTTTQPHPPLALFGLVPRSCVAVLYVGTSIEDGTGDGTGISADGAVAYVGRGLENVNGFNLPSAKLSRGGERLMALADPVKGALRLSLLPYCTHFIGMSATNDIIAGDSLATIQGYCNTIWAAARARGVQKIAWPNVIPRCPTSTDSWATTAGQTPASGFAVGGTRDQYNAWLLTKLADGTIDYVLDFNSICADPTLTDRFRVDLGAGNNTTDGVHPGTPLHTLGATMVNGVASTWTAQ